MLIVNSMSGHSKWHSIKHKKAITDSKKGKVFSKISRIIGVAVRDKGSDPDKNPSLRLAIEKARQANMPNENIQRIIKKYSGGEGAEKYEEIVFEGYGPGGVALIIETITDSRNRISQEIKHLLSSHNGNLAIPGSVIWMFEKKGKIILSQKQHDYDSLEAFAIEAGADDITKENDSIIILTDPTDLHNVKTFLEQKNILIESAELEYIPKNIIDIDSDEIKKQIDDLFSALDENDDVQEIYANLI